jgi:hypothetical protein
MRVPIGIAVLMVTIAIAAYGQAAPACAGPHDRLKSFDTQRREPFIGGVSTTIPPNPALLPLVPDLISGVTEIREQLDYDRHESAILLTTFITDSTALFPTPVADLPALNFCSAENGPPCAVERATLEVKHIFTSCKPLPSLMFQGVFGKNAPDPGGWGIGVGGATFALSTGYTTESDPNPPGSTYNPFTGSDFGCGSGTGMFNVTESVAGVGVAWAPCAVGTLSFEHGHGHEEDNNGAAGR